MPAALRNADNPKTNAAVSTITQILRRLGSDLFIGPNGESVSRAEALAAYLWELALNKQVELPTGEIVKATNSEWLEITFRIIERMEGKPMQAISAEVSHGMTIVRTSRMLDKVKEAEALDVASTPKEIIDG